MVVMEGWEVVTVTGTVTDSGTPSALADVPLGPSVTTECAGVVQITRTSMAGAGGHKTSSQGSVTNAFLTKISCMSSWQVNGFLYQENT